MEAIVLPLFLMDVLGMPFSWPKLTAGFVVNWIGLEVNVREWSLGLSSRRATWVVGWLDRTLAAGAVQLGELMQALGRMQYAYGVLRWDRPFLAPLYTLVHSGGPEERLPLPPFVSSAMRWLRDRLQIRRSIPCGRQTIQGHGIFRVDAKAEGNDVALGGWMPHYLDDGKVDLARSPWFSVALTAETAPWAFVHGEPYKTVASLELLATVMGLMLFSPAVPDDTVKMDVVSVSSLTDSSVASAVLSKGATTSFRLCVIAMEAAAQMEALRLDLTLQWIPRDANEEADALSNLRFEGFSPEQRLEASLDRLPLMVLPLLLEDALAFHAVPRKTRPPWRRAGRARKRLRETDPW